MLYLLLCEYILLGFRGGMCERRTRTRKGMGADFFFYLAGIQILRNAPLGTYFPAKTGNSGCDLPCCFSAASLGEVFLAQGRPLAPRFYFPGCAEPLSCCHTLQLLKTSVQSSWGGCRGGIKSPFCPLASGTLWCMVLMLRMD